MVSVVYTTPNLAVCTYNSGGKCIVVLNVTDTINDNHFKLVDLFDEILYSIKDNLGVAKILHLFIPASTTNEQLYYITSILACCSESKLYRKIIKRVSLHLFYYRIEGKNEPHRYTVIARDIIKGMDKDTLSSWVKLDGSQYTTISLSKDFHGTNKICIDNVYTQKSSKLYEVPALRYAHETKDSICESYINSIKMKEVKL